MKIPLNWLRDYVDLPNDVDALCEKLTMLGLEIESVARPGDGVQNVVVGKILEIAKHPDADSIVVCKTDVGQGEPLTICCGAKNMKVGDKVPTAVVGASLPNGMAIGKRKMRGVESQGMMCAPDELGLGEDHDGLLILSPDAPIGQDVRPILGLDDVILEIEVTPNRGDWAGLIGIARELSAAYGVPLKMPDAIVQESGKNAADVATVSIEAPDLCPRYIGRVIAGIKVSPSPDWLRRRLEAAGQRSINNAVDITNYILLETGQPLHAFDHKRLKNGAIVVRRARAGERMVTLDEADRALTPEMLVIADAAVPVAVAGVMGGRDSEVGEATTDILLESAWFDPRSVRATARALAMNTEASQRFQRGADIEMTEFASRRAAKLFCEVAGGTLLRGALDVYPKPPQRKSVPLRFARTGAFLGTSVSPETQQKYLNALGFRTQSKTADAVTLEVPTWRHDVSREVDFIEEIARLHGYDAIPVSMPRVHRTETDLTPEYRAERRLREYLTRVGLFETVTWSFMAAQDAGHFKNGGAGEAIPLVNPLSESHALLRPSLLPALVRTVSLNRRKNRASVAVFEIAPTYRREGQHDIQRIALAIGLSGAAADRHWSRPERPFDVFDLKGLVEGALDSMGCSNPQFAAVADARFVPGTGAAVSRDGAVIGVFGRLAPSVGSAYDLDTPAFVAELEIDTLLRQSAGTAQFTEIPAHPPALRDLAVVVDEQTPAGELAAAAAKAGGALLKHVEVFDIYRGKSLPAGKKSVALNLTFQSHERTLTDQDTEKAIQKILKTLDRQFQATLR